jgi:carbon-monoxide dehydrogenase medium subunit/xanthine dehydrogenase FAD-binding subunit
MQELSYHKPQSLGEAVALMAQYAGSIRPYAGGTDLMVQLREGAKRLKDTQHLMDLGAVPELKGIELLPDVIRIGAMTTHTEVNRSELLRKHAHMLSVASSTVGAEQIRNNGTIGGNICNGSPAADTLSPLVALNASIRLVSVRGERTLLVKDIYTGAGQVSLAPDELAICLEIPRIDGYGTSFIKLGRRKALAISRMNAAVALKIEGGVIREARIAPGCVFAVPDRVWEAEKALIGKAPSEELFYACGDMAAEQMIATTGVRWSTQYKQPVIKTLVKRALCEAAEASV